MNQTSHIIKLLENAGLHVRNITGGYIVMEDPACISRGFQDFFHDAWIVITIITGLLVMMWGISMIRGAKQDIKNNFKVLVLILSILSVTWPILNLIYGGDLLGAGCKDIKVSMTEVKSLVSTRVGGDADAGLYEDIDIYDSGQVYIQDDEMPEEPDIDYLFEEKPDEPEDAPGNT
ncbi:MAG: hypothetical protein J5742_03240 [Alphaproteobacteria bacterium]|nr:hypothetical protein [Alphaproteobacteria bacterium]